MLPIPGDVIGLAGVPVIIGLLEVFVKPFIADKRLWPIYGLVLGLIINVVLTYPGDLRAAIVYGVLAGLAASGLYSGGKALMGN